jgi:uncharacterized Zn-binding protein involved in type VI secretion
MKPIIHNGDALREFSGEVRECYGLPIACLGDAVRCNLCGLNRIGEGSDLMQADDKPVALDVHRCACGCSLVSSLVDTETAVES